LAFGRNKRFELITAFSHVKLIGHVGHTNGLVNHNSQIQPQLIVVIAKDFKIYLFFQEDCRIFCESVKDRCNGLIRDGGVGYTGIDGSLIKPIAASINNKFSKGLTKSNNALPLCWQTKQTYRQQIRIQHLSIGCCVDSDIKS
jgi:hypothetical protein